MQKLKSRLYLFGVILLIAGGIIMGSAFGRSEPHRDERFMESHAPPTVDGAGFARSTDNPEQSYRMDANTYKELNAYGIVCRQYQTGTSSIDTVLIASREKGSFHDPRVCLHAQGMTSTWERVVPVATKMRGDVPVRVAYFHNDFGKDQLIAYFYKGPYGFRDNPNSLKLDIFKEQLIHGRNPESVFYRFIAPADDFNEKQFLAWIGDYMDAASTSSQGFF